MMKRLYYRLKAFFEKPSTQDDLIRFISDKKNLNKAVEGSMQRRIELFDRVKIRKNNI